MLLKDLSFRRLFACNLYKNLRLGLAELSLTADFVHTDRGDPYPLLEKAEGTSETVAAGAYTVNGRVMRLFAAYFPFAVCECRLRRLDGRAGFAFVREEGRVTAAFSTAPDGTLRVTFDDGKTAKTLETGEPFEKDLPLQIACRAEAFDVYCGALLRYAGSFSSPVFADGRAEKVFTGAKIAFFADGNVTTSKVSAFLDCGIAQADVRPVCYENGEVIAENGKITLTASLRLQAGTYQGVLAWTPGTSDFALVGAIFFDAGDGVWQNDVATSLKFDRRHGRWLLWTCVFSHGHVLAHASFDGDVRYGVNVVGVTPLPAMRGTDDDTVLCGKPDDEDPDFLFDEKSGKWLLSVCRMTQRDGQKRYRYHLFTSDDPFEGYTFLAASATGDETGGSLISFGGALQFACGSDYDRRSVYRLYTLPDMAQPSPIRCDLPDGGFRGWGTLIPVRKGARTHVYHVTFDRMRASDWNWSYGNLYVFEAILPPESPKF